MTQILEAPNFSEMAIGQLRNYAKHLRVAVPKTATKQDIIDLINNKLRNKTVAEIADSGSTVKPGYSKIRVHQDPMPGASNMPVYVNANGYICTIPRGVEVIVPNRVVRTLNDAVVLRRKQSIGTGTSGREEFQTTENIVHSYPFSVLEQVPGPEILTPHEISKRKTYGPRARYAAKFGRWPRPRDLTRAIEQGLIALEDDEELGAGVEPELK